MNARTEFPVDAAQPPGLRRAALALHATGAADRDWLLAQLPIAHRTALQAMLQELADLGVPPDRELTQRLLAKPVRAAAPAENAAPVAPAAQAGRGHAWLASVLASDLARVLQGEPAALVAHALRLLGATQREAVLALLAGPLRRQAAEHLREQAGAEHAGAPGLTQALLAELAARLAQAPERRVSRFAWAGRLRQALRGRSPA